ncbi:hypothetical protein RHGRI_023843 [Rhododendron griersonianum]|uniref:Uncharacterized protein n=1 Tax=Rhododendron griersonianum TaxID=479676 RepID=A0AAV6J9G9_9ERIC|nr:hypothetical protein RHGRI_023843 [Rhododendron griersonianum]
MWMWEESSDENVTDDENPGRRFLGCINYKIQKLALEEWSMLRSCKPKRKHLREKLKMMIESLERGKQIMEEENEAIVVKMADLIEENMNLTASNEALQAQIEVWKTQARKTRVFGTCLRGKIIVVVVLLSVIVFMIGVLVSSVNYSPKKKNSVFVLNMNE